MLEWKPEVKEALQKINFVGRYEELSGYYNDKRTPENERLIYIDGEEVIETIHDLGYDAKFDAREKFYKLQEEEREGYTFGFHIILRDGTVEIVWVVKKEKEVLLGSPWGVYSKRLIRPDYIIKKPVIGDYEDLEQVLKTAFAMFEDFKNAFLSPDVPKATDVSETTDIPKRSLLWKILRKKD